jgi:hypothetical protein
MYALKKSSAYGAISAVVLIGAAVGISASTVSRADFQRGNTSSDARLTQSSFRWPTPVGVTVSRNKTMSVKSTSAQNNDSDAAGTHREQKSFRWMNSDAGASVPEKMKGASAQYVPTIGLRTYKHSIDFDGYCKYNQLLI